MDIESLFARASRLAAGDRSGFLDRECPDPGLRARVEALLATTDGGGSEGVLSGEATRTFEVSGEATRDSDANANAEAGAFAEAGAGAGAGAGVLAGGRYRLLERIGEGGMGTVWRAEQTAPVRRLVALKLVRADHGASRGILARFEAERQAIAMMDHPNIAKLLDAGTTERGEPYFAMELVRGAPLNEHCDRKRLTVGERLELFARVCSAVRHAHQKGVIHRDLKPSNILVEDSEGCGTPKVIDFGLAKATGGTRLTEDSMALTGAGVFLGTPLYMAPEQAGGGDSDVDTRADVYALGAILFELLTGTTPITRETMRRAALDEAVRLIREGDTPAPSARLASGDGIASAASNRRTEPSRLRRVVRGDLDWIVLKAVAKERERRYGSAGDLGRDVERFLNHEPVEAGPPSAWYRARKFARRHRGAVIGGGLTLCALLLGLGGTAWQAARAERARAAEADQRLLAEESGRRAERSAEAERAAAARAEARLGQIELINRTIFDLFGELDARRLRSEGIPVEAALGAKLSEMGRRLDEEAIGDATVLADLRDRLGRTLLNLGRAAEASEFLERAADWRRSEFGEGDPRTLFALNNLANAYGQAGRAGEAAELLERVHGGLRDRLGPDDAETLASLGNLAEALLRAGKTGRALELSEEVWERRRRISGPDAPETLLAENNRGSALLAAGRAGEAATVLERGLAAARSNPGSDHPDTISRMDNLANALRATGRFDAALELFGEVIERRRRVLGSDHAMTLMSMNNLAVLHSSMGKVREALELHEAILPARRRALGADHPQTLNSLANLANCLSSLGEFGRAAPMLEEALAGQTARLGGGHPSTLITKGSLARAYAGAARRAGDRFVPRGGRGASGAIGRGGAAAFAGMLAVVGGDALEAGWFAFAEELLRECLAIREKTPGADDPASGWLVFNTKSTLGEAILSQGRTEEAEPLLTEGHAGLRARWDATEGEEGHPARAALRERVPEAIDRLIRLYEETGREEEARAHRELRARFAGKRG